MRVCRLCGERPVSPARVKANDYRCWRCRYNTASEQKARARYRRSPLGRALQKRDNDRRILVGDTYYSRAASVDLARVINTYIKDKRHAFIKGQSDREKTEVAPACRVSIETAV